MCNKKNTSHLIENLSRNLPSYSAVLAPAAVAAMLMVDLVYADTIQIPVQQKKYATNIELAIRGGNKRNIGRLGMVIPVLQNDNSLFHITLIGMVDSKTAREGNFGLGYRHRHDNTIYGVYGFYDIRRSARRNNLRQWTFGAEILREHVEFRINTYLAMNKKYETSGKNRFKADFDGHRTRLTSEHMATYEKSLSGFDIEVGSTIPGYEQFQAHLAYYYFGIGSKDVKKVKGMRARSAWQVADWLALESEVSHDKVRKTNFFAGVRFNWTLGEHSKSRLDTLDKKMTSLPVRDIDIVSGISAPQVAHSEQLLDIEGLAAIGRGLEDVEGNATISSFSDELGNAIFDFDELAALSKHHAGASVEHVVQFTDHKPVTVRLPSSTSAALKGEYTSHTAVLATAGFIPPPPPIVAASAPKKKLKSHEKARDAAPTGMGDVLGELQKRFAKRHGVVSVKAPAKPGGKKEPGKLFDNPLLVKNMKSLSIGLDKMLKASKPDPKAPPITVIPSPVSTPTIISPQQAVNLGGTIVPTLSSAQHNVLRIDGNGTHAPIYLKVRKSMPLTMTPAGSSAIPLPPPSAPKLLKKSYKPADGSPQAQLMQAIRDAAKKNSKAKAKAAAAALASTDLSSETGNSLIDALREKQKSMKQVQAGAPPMSIDERLRAAKAASNQKKAGQVGSAVIPAWQQQLAAKHADKKKAADKLGAMYKERLQRKALKAELLAQGIAAKNAPAAPKVVPVAPKVVPVAPKAVPVAPHTTVSHDAALQKKLTKLTALLAGKKKPTTPTTAKKLVTSKIRERAKGATFSGTGIGGLFDQIKHVELSPEALAQEQEAERRAIESQRKAAQLKAARDAAELLRKDREARKTPEQRKQEERAADQRRKEEAAKKREKEELSRQKSDKIDEMNSTLQEAMKKIRIGTTYDSDDDSGDDWD